MAKKCCRAGFGSIFCAKSKQKIRYWFDQEAVYSQFFSVAFGYERLLSHVNFSYCNRKGQNSCYKLPKYGNEVTQDVEQSDLDWTNLLRRLHHVANCPKR